MMKSRLLPTEFAYDGTQLRSLYAYLEHKLQGDSVVAWIGSCDISFEHMVDGEDFLEGATIAGSRMVHFIIERFHTPLFAAVAVQRLFASICMDFIRTRLSPTDAASLRRDGDDIFFREGKLSISIATVSPVSSLIHFAVNCSNEGTPVKTSCLADLGVEPRDFTNECMTRLTREIQSIEEATVKVKWVT